MKSKDNIFESISEKIVSAQTRSPKSFLIIFAIITLLLIPGIFNLVGNVEPSLEKVLPSDIEEVKTMNDMRSQFSADMMYVIVYADTPVYDVRNPEFVKYVDLLSSKFEDREYIVQVSDIADIVKQSNNQVIPNTKQEIQNLLNLNPMTFQFVNSDYSFSVIRIKSDTGANAQTISKVVSEIEEDIANIEVYNPGSYTQITGFNAIDKATFEIIMSDFASITLVSMLFISIVVFFTFKSLSKGMLPMVVVMNALVWTMGVAGYMNLTITVVSMVAAAMIMGLGIDFGIHVVHSYFDNRKNHSRKDALKETMKELLRAMVGASLTTIAGFLALLFGVLPAMKTLGIILGIGIFNTLLGAVFLLPVIVYMYDKKSVSNNKNKLKSKN